MNEQGYGAAVACLFVAAVACIPVSAQAAPRRGDEVHGDVSSCPASWDAVPNAMGTRRRSGPLLAAHPVGIRLCRYSGIYPKPSAEGNLAQERIIKGRVATSVASEFRNLDRLRAGPVITCPEDYGSRMAVFVDYAGGVQQRVEMSLSGCLLAWSPHVRGSFAVVHHLYARLRRMTRGHS